MKPLLRTECAMLETCERGGQGLYGLGQWACHLLRNTRSGLWLPFSIRITRSCISLPAQKHPVTCMVGRASVESEYARRVRIYLVASSLSEFQSVSHVL